MFDPCEKEKKEYEKALRDEKEVKKHIPLSLQSLGTETPPPIDLNAVKDFREKEEILKLKKKELDECVKRNL